MCEVRDPEYEISRSIEGQWQILVRLPGVLKGKEVEVDVVENSSLEIGVTGKYRLQVVVPDDISTESAKVQFSRRDQVMRITCPKRASQPAEGNFQSGVVPNASVKSLAAATRDTAPATQLLLNKFRDFPAELKESASQGRHVCAKEDLLPGNLVFQEEPLVSVIHDKYVETLCHECYTHFVNRGCTPIRCPGCKWAMYCGEACLQKARQRHADVCPVLHTWVTTNSGPKDSRGLRMLVQAAALHARDPEAAGLINLLQSHISGKSKAELTRLHNMAQGVQRFLPSNASLDMDTIVEVISKAHVNLHGVSDAAGHTLGTGLFVGASQFNHSCLPNCVVSYIDGALTVRAISPVKKGEPLCIGYIELYQSREIRRHSLMQSKSFHCECLRCSSQELIQLDEPLTAWRCEKCTEGWVAETAQRCWKCHEYLAVDKESRTQAVAECKAAQMAATEHMQAGRFGDSQRMLTSILEETQQRLHACHEVRFAAHSLLAAVYAETKLWEASAKQGKLAIKCMRKVFPKNHPALASTQVQVGDAIVEHLGVKRAAKAGDKEQQKEALKLYEGAGRILRLAYGSEHTDVADIRMKEALLREALGARS
ncbi:hypothetical protein CYMTET_7798 [Cymbomonas tetramitiformis]|uniref:SET domain-containing protein n=1 Tax=Cymbomonas tetramitiformis TaxID=36881 RepID=A0AAE0GUY1_9CHLO|nr:hypothetical protein CYMTET_7798 [Cymbomonas tetramitiformis]